MTTAEYLEQLFDITDRGNFYLKEAEKWHEIATSISVSYDKEPVKSSGNKQKMENASVNAVYYEQKAREKIQHYFNLRDVIISQIIEMSGDKIYRQILYKHYVEDFDLPKVADEIGYSYSHTRRMFRKSLDIFEKEYGRTYMNTNNHV